MAELMGDPRDPDAQDGAPTAADDAPTLVLETAPVDTAAAVQGDAAAAREAAAHFAKGEAHFERREWAEALKAYRTAAGADPKMSVAWYYISAAEREMNGRKPCDAEYLPLMHCIRLDPNKDTSPITGAALANTTLTPNRAVKKILEWFMLTCEKAGADAEELC